VSSLTSLETWYEISEEDIEKSVSADYFGWQLNTTTQHVLRLLEAGLKSNHQVKLEMFVNSGELQISITSQIPYESGMLSLKLKPIPEFTRARSSIDRQENENPAVIIKSLTEKIAVLEKKVNELSGLPGRMSEVEDKVNKMKSESTYLPSIILSNATCSNAQFWQWNIEYYDNEFFALSTKISENDSIEVKKEGLYLVHVRTTTKSSGANNYVALYKNASQYAVSYHSSTTACYDSCIISIVIRLNQGDFLQVYQSVNGLNAYNEGNSLSNSFCVTYMGQANYYY